MDHALHLLKMASSNHKGPIASYLLFCLFVQLTVLPQGLFSQHTRSGKPHAPWEAAANYRYNKAYNLFRQAQTGKNADDARLNQFGEALMLLNIQPRTMANIENARFIFEQISNDSVQDDLSQAALYYLGRVYQIHQRESDWAQAAETFTRLINSRPAHPYAQLATARLATLLLYEPGVDHAEIIRRYEKLRVYQNQLTFQPAKRDFNYVMGVACLSLDISKEAAIEHLLVLEACEIHQKRSLASLYIRVGETAAQLGRTDLAQEYFRKFLDTYPRELRTTLVQSRLSELKEQPGD